MSGIVIFSGRVTSGPEPRDYNGGSSVTFDLTHDGRSWTGMDGTVRTERDTATFRASRRVNDPGTKAYITASSLQLGDFVIVKGEIRSRSYMKNGEERTFTFLEATDFLDAPIRVQSPQMPQAPQAQAQPNDLPF